MEAPVEGSVESRNLDVGNTSREPARPFGPLERDVTHHVLEQPHRSEILGRGPHDESGAVTRLRQLGVLGDDLAVTHRDASVGVSAARGAPPSAGCSG